MNFEGFCRAYVRTKGNMTTKDFLDNGYTMEHFIRWSQVEHDYEKGLVKIIAQYEKLAEKGNPVATACLKVLKGEETA